MQVYVELSFLENFCMDYVLLYVSKWLSHTISSRFRISFSAATGGVVALLFPLLPLPRWSSLLCKLLVGALMCLPCGKFSTLRAYLKFIACFYLCTFLLGGFLFALTTFQLVGVGVGNFVTKIPIGVCLFVGLILCGVVRRIAMLWGKRQRGYVLCTLQVGKRQLQLVGFYDSGNAVYFHGSPVNVLSKRQASHLVDVNTLCKQTQIHTASGEGTLPLFYAKMQLKEGKRIRTYPKVVVGVGVCPQSQIILHSDYSEA